MEKYLVGFIFGAVGAWIVFDTILQYAYRKGYIEYKGIEND